MNVLKGYKLQADNVTLDGVHSEAAAETANQIIGLQRQFVVEYRKGTK